MGAVDGAGAQGAAWNLAGRVDRLHFFGDGNFSADSHGRIAGGGMAGCAVALAEDGGGGLSGSKNAGNCAGAGEEWDAGIAGGGLAGVSGGEARWSVARGFDQYG